jgi:hypothetical protein
MSIDFLQRFTGQANLLPGPTAPLCANPAVERPLTLQLLLAGPVVVDPKRLTDWMRAVSPETTDTRTELAPEPVDGKVIGMVGWGLHLIKLIAVNEPFSTDLLEFCLQPAHFSAELKAITRRHQTHLLLYYGGWHEDPLEQYVALSAVAAHWNDAGGLTLLNAAARAAFPAPALTPPPDEPSLDLLEYLRSIPIPMLYGGFVKMEIEQIEGVWMRTWGNHLLELPNLAMHTAGHHHGQDTFNLFNGLLEYLRQSGNKFDAGHTMQVGDELFLRVRYPNESEWFLHSDGELFVLEEIEPSEANVPPAQD